MAFIAFDRRRDVPFRLLLPNFLTTIALCCGMASIHFTLKAAGAVAAGEEVSRTGGLLRFNEWEKALAFIFVAAVFDMLDGRAARMLKAQSPFGAMLDSLSDFLAFGIAPGVLLHQWTLKGATVLGKDAEIFALAAVMTYILCSAMRLARFTAATRQVRASGAAPPPDPRPSSVASRFFVGMPTPAAAAAVLIPPMMENSSKIGYRVPDVVVILFTFLIAGLMIGRQPMYSFKKIRVPRRMVAPLLVGLALLMALAVKQPWLTGVLLAGGYLLTTPLSMLSYRRMMKSQPRGGETAPNGSARARIASVKRDDV